MSTQPGTDPAPKFVIAGIAWLPGDPKDEGYDLLTCELPELPLVATVCFNTKMPVGYARLARHESGAILAAIEGYDLQDQLDKLPYLAIGFSAKVLSYYPSVPNPVTIETIAFCDENADPNVPKWVYAEVEV